MIDLASTTILGGGGGVKPIPTVIPEIEYEKIHHVGATTLWVGFAVMVLASAVFALMSWNIPVSKRVYHVLTTTVTIIAALSYFAMASGDGVSYKCESKTDYHEHLPDTHHDVCRQIYWARYVDWSLTTPLLLVELCLLAGVDGAHTLMATTASLIMTLTGLFAAFGNQHTFQKWGWFTIACVAYLFVIWHVALHGSRVVRAKGDAVARHFGGLAAFLFVLWTIYPIVWGIAEGAHRTSVDTSVVVYTVLDILAKVGFGLWLLAIQRRTPETNVDLDGYWSNGLASEGRIRIGDPDNA